MNMFHKHRRLFICILIAILTSAVYLPVRKSEFLYYDDDVYVTNNQQVKSGLSWDGVKWAFTTGHASNWHPLTWLSLMLDCELFGVKPGPVHLVNLVFHIANSILVFLVFARITKGLWQSAFIAGLFALHPLHVESVVWAAERKDVLSTFFWFLTMLAYAGYVQRRSVNRYFITLVLFALGLLAKPMLVTLPFVLLLMDYWPLERFGRQGISTKIIFLEKVPMIILSAVSSVVTFIVQRQGGAMISIYEVSLGERISNAIISYVSYIGKMLWPGSLAILYPHPVNKIPVTNTIICAGLLIFITIICLYYVRQRKYLVIGWLFYLGTLVPVIGIVQVGSQSMADRYTYIPLIGLFLIIAFLGTELFNKILKARFVKFLIPITILTTLGITAAIQVTHWKDSKTIFEHALKVTKNNYLVENNYANILSSAGRDEEAIAHLIKAVKLLPNSPEIHNNYGNILKTMGKYDQAIEQYEIAYKINPQFTLARYQIGVTFAAKGDYRQAIEQYRLYASRRPDLREINPHQEKSANNIANRFSVVMPDTGEVISNFGYAVAQSGNPKDAIEYYKKALAKNPDDIITHGRLALALAAVNRIDEAIEHCRIVLAAKPDDVEMHTNLGILLQSQNRLDEAIESFNKALQADPKFQKARDCLSAAIALKKSQQ